VTHGASKGGVAPASSEFGRVLPGFLCAGYLVSFCEVRSNIGLKPKILWPEGAEAHFCWSFRGLQHGWAFAHQIDSEINVFLRVGCTNARRTASPFARPKSGKEGLLSAASQSTNSASIKHFTGL